MVIWVIVMLVASLYELRFDRLYSSDATEKAAYTEFYVGNVTTGDLLTVVCFGWHMLSRGFQQFLTMFFKSRLGAVSIGLACVLVFGPLLMGGDVLYNLKQAVQFGFVLLVLIPLLAYGISSAQYPVRICRHLAVFYLLVVWGGLFIFYRYDSSAVFRAVGGRRIMCTMGIDALHYVALAYGVAVWVSPAKLSARVLGIFCIGTYLGCAALSASRTLFVSFTVVAFVVPIVYLASRGKLRVVFYAVVAAVLVALVFQVLFVRESERILVRQEGFADTERLSLIENGVKSALAVPWRVFTGFGWDKSGIHNFVFQTLIDAGVAVCGLFTVVLLLPFFALWRLRRETPTAAVIGLGILAGFIVHYSLNALPTLRVYWVPFGVAVGLAMCPRGKRAAMSVQTGS